ncbi:hypothetical protein ACFE04_019313 [Oxalis oulophora]
MSTICADHQHHRGHGHYSVEVPPRKQLLLRRKVNDSHVITPMAAQQYLFPSGGDELIVDHHLKFLPFNNGDGDDDCDSDDPYASDHFRMYEFKIRRCTRSRSHDWTDCPFAHPGEKARRRDPRRYHYTGTVCSDFRRGTCSRGDDCEFSHGVFECWLHPSRYRTEACKDGKNCKRKICFFAHTTRQLRILPESNNNTEFNPNVDKHKPRKGSHYCCAFCHSKLTAAAVVASSPTSTLFRNVSPPMSPCSQSISPPVSPAASHRYNNNSPISRYNNNSSYKLSNSALANYNNNNVTLSELMTSLEAMNFSSENSSPISPSFSWIDADLSTDNHHDLQQQFVLSPIPPPPARVRNVFSNQESNVNINGTGVVGSSSIDPDLGWVNDLLM